MTDTHLIFPVPYRIWALVLGPNGSFRFAERNPPNGQVMFQIQRLLTQGLGSHIQSEMVWGQSSAAECLLGMREAQRLQSEPGERN